MLSDASRAHMELYLTGAVPEGHAPLLKHGDWWDRVHSLLAEQVMKRSDIAAMVSHLAYFLVHCIITWCKRYTSKLALCSATSYCC
jgi:hypothetical protein